MAATNINRVVLTGNLTRDPELRSTPSGMSVCSLRIASNTRRKDNASGEWIDKPNYFSVTVWGAHGENCARFLSKGRPVCIDGRMEWRDWTAQDGTKREAVEIVADAVQFLGARDDTSSSTEEYRGEPVAAGAGTDPDDTPSTPPGFGGPRERPAASPAAAEHRGRRSPHPTVTVRSLYMSDRNIIDELIGIS